MSFADPAVITVAGVPLSLVRINQDGYSSEYKFRSNATEYKLVVRNSSYVNKKTGRTIDRHNIEFTQVVFPTATAPEFSRKSYFVIENQQGDTLQNSIDLAAGLCNSLTANTNANIVKMLNFES